MTYYHPEPQFTLRFILGVLRPLSFARRLMTCIHHCCIVQSSFTALEILFAPPVHPSLPPSPALVTNYVFTVSIDLQAVLFLSCWHWVRPLAAFKIFLLIPDFKQFDYAMPQHNFVGLVFSVWFCFLTSMCLKFSSNLGIFLPLFLQAFFSVPSFFLGISSYMSVRPSQVTVLFTYFQSCFLCVSLWIASTARPSSPLTFPPAMSILLLIPPSVLFISDIIFNL